MFLNDSFTPRRTSSNIESHQDVTSNSAYNTENMPVSKKAKRKFNQTVEQANVSEEREMMCTAVNFLRSSSESNKAGEKIPEKTADDLFCEMMAKQLRKLRDGAQKEFLKRELQRLVVNAMFPQQQMQNQQMYTPTQLMHTPLNTHRRVQPPPSFAYDDTSPTNQQF